MTIQILRPHADDPSKADLIGQYKVESKNSDAHTFCLKVGASDIPVAQGDIIVEVAESHEHPRLPYHHVNGQVGAFLGIRRK